MVAVKSCSTRNAVKVVAFGFNFSNKILDSEIDSIIEKLLESEILKAQFEATITDEISMTIGPDGIPHQRKSKGGIYFSKINQKCSINITKDFVVITHEEYTRWDKIIVEVYEYIHELFNILQINLNQLTLEYLDEFEILDIKNEWTKELFNNNSQYLSPIIYTFSDYWHINQGAFIKVENIPHKLLDNININYFADEQDNLKDKVNIRAHHRLLLESQEKFSVLFREYFQHIHMHSKNIFENIINENIIKEFNEE